MTDQVNMGRVLRTAKLFCMMMSSWIRSCMHWTKPEHLTVQTVKPGVDASLRGQPGGHGILREMLMKEPN